MGNEFESVIDGVNRGRPKPTAYTERKLRALRFVGSRMEYAIGVLLDASPQTAKRFISQVRAGDIFPALLHGNRGRRSAAYQTAYEEVSSLYRGKRSRGCSSVAICRELATMGIPVPSARTVRYWVRHDFGKRRRRRRRKKAPPGALRVWDARPLRERNEGF